MALLNDEAAQELVGNVKAATSATREAVEERLAKSRDRLRSQAKTRKSAQTRQRIMDAASDLMMERGNTNFQMSEVSDRCQMSKGSLYYYFADRDELIKAIFDESIDELVDGMEEVVSQAASARDALVRLIAEFTRLLRGGSPLGLAMTYELAGSAGSGMPEVTSHFERAAKLLATQLERAKEEGIVRDDVDTEVAAVYATGGFIATSLARVNRRVEDDPDVVTRHLVDVTLRGMGVEGATL